MSIQIAKFGINNIDDINGLDSLTTALKNIDGVTSIELNSASHFGVVHYDDTKTSFYAIKAALNTVDYITQPFPEDAPQNPNNL